MYMQLQLSSCLKKKKLQLCSKCTVPSYVTDFIIHSITFVARTASTTHRLRRLWRKYKHGTALRPRAEIFVYLLAVAARGKRHGHGRRRQGHVKMNSCSVRRAVARRARRPRALRQVAGRSRAPVSAAGIRPGPATEKSCRATTATGTAEQGPGRRASRQAPRDDDAIPTGSTVTRPAAGGARDASAVRRPSVVHACRYGTVAILKTTPVFLLLERLLLSHVPAPIGLSVHRLQ
jgi:hypothetical protein